MSPEDDEDTKVETPSRIEAKGKSEDTKVDSRARTGEWLKPLIPQGMTKGEELIREWKFNRIIIERGFVALGDVS